MSFESEIEIEAPPERVFALATDPTRFAEWQKDVVRVVADERRPLTVGSRFTTTRRFGGAERQMTQEVIEVDAPRRWAVRGVDGPIRPSASIVIEPLDAGRASRLRFTIDYEAHGIGRALMPLVSRQTEKGAPISYRNLKALLERPA